VTLDARLSIMSPRPAIVPQVKFAPDINGKPALPPKGDQVVPSYRVDPCEDLAMRVEVAVPEHVTVTALWFGISTGTWGLGPDGRPTGMSPILAHYQHPLRTGSHTFTLRWRAPVHPSAARLYLTFAWSSSQPPASVSGHVAQFVLDQATR
jgi:hypothetical protein